MAEPSLKVVLEAPATSGTPTAEMPRRRLSRGRLRMILLVVAPVIVAAIGIAIYLSSGRYITTDNAYVGAPKVLITPDISGKTAHVKVREGQAVKAGDELFEIDPQPFRLAMQQAAAKLANVRTDFAILKSSLQSLTRLADLAEQNVELKKRDLERKNTLNVSRTSSQADVDNAAFAVVTAQTLAQNAAQRRSDALNQLLGNPDLPIEQYPAFMQASAALDQAKRDLNHTLMRAPIDGIATQVDNIQLGRYVTAGTPVLSVIDTSAAWVDANPKETDITHLHIGQRALVIVDTFPDATFYGTVIAVSPGTGAQFAILPPQNASGNWVKVVQRVPVRVQLDRGPMTSELRAGMSAYVEIDTGHRGPFHALFGGGTDGKETK